MYNQLSSIYNAMPSMSSMYNAMPSPSSLYNQAYNYAAPKLAGALNDYTGTKAGQHFLEGNTREGFNQLGDYFGNTMRNYARNSIDAALPEHVGSGYGMKANPKFGIRATPRLSDAFMDSPIQYGLSDAGGALGKWYANEQMQNLGEGKTREEFRPYEDLYARHGQGAADWLGRKVGSGITSLGRKVLDPFLPTGYADMTPNELSSNMGHRMSDAMYNMLPTRYQSPPQQNVSRIDPTIGSSEGLAHGGYVGTRRYIPTLQEIAEMI